MPPGSCFTRLTLVADATRVNLRALRERGEGSPALPKYAEIGEVVRAKFIAAMR